MKADWEIELQKKAPSIYAIYQSSKYDHRINEYLKVVGQFCSGSRDGTIEARWKESYIKFVGTKETVI